MSKTLRNAELYFREGTSDKVYNMYLTEESGTTDPYRYRVKCEWGRRGWPKLNITWKTGDLPANYLEATRIFDEVLKEKRNKGYVLDIDSQQTSVKSTPKTAPTAPPKPNPETPKINLNPSRLIELE